MANNIQLIGCTNVRVSPDAENIIAISCSDKSFTSSDNNTINLYNDSFIVNEDGSLTANIEPVIEIETANFNTDVSKTIYFCNATSGSQVADLQGGTYKPMTFIKTDATANTIALTPASGVINGAVSFLLTAQYQKVTVCWDGTNFYV